jgi:hypothetical protein
MKTAVITLLAAIPMGTADAQDGWRKYRNNAAGWSITYRANLTFQPPAPDAVAMNSSSHWRIKDFHSNRPQDDVTPTIGGDELLGSV